MNFTYEGSLRCSILSKSIADLLYVLASVLEHFYVCHISALWRDTAFLETFPVSVLNAPKSSGQPDVSKVSCTTTASKSKLITRDIHVKVQGVSAQPDAMGRGRLPVCTNHYPFSYTLLR